MLARAADTPMFHKIMQKTICLQLSLLTISSLLTPIQVFAAGENSGQQLTAAIKLRAMSPKLDKGKVPLQASVKYLDMRVSSTRAHRRVHSRLVSHASTGSFSARARRYTAQIAMLSSGAPRFASLAAKSDNRSGALRATVEKSGTRKATLHTGTMKSSVGSSLLQSSIGKKDANGKALSATISAQSSAPTLKAMQASFEGMSRPFNLNAGSHCTCGGKGALLESEHKWAEAAAYHRTLLDRPGKKNSEQVGLLNSLAWDYAHSERVDDSIGLATRALGYDPSNFYVIGTRGYAYLRQGNLKKAEPDLERAVKLGGQAADSYYLAICYARSGKLAKARTVLRKAQELKYEDTDGDWRMASDSGR